MSSAQAGLVERIKAQLGDMVSSLDVAHGEVTLTCVKERIRDVCVALRDGEGLKFEQLMDLCGVDYSEYGEGSPRGPRFAVVYHLLSISLNQRVRVKAPVEMGVVPRIASVISIWNSADWYEREAFDLFGIVFEGHPDLRRLLTDYGFVGHPFRKDFPLIGNVEMRYDPEKKRVVYEPVSIEPRILVPRVIRDDSRYVEAKERDKGRSERG